MNTLVPLILQTLMGKKIEVNADNELASFLESASPSDTRTLRNYFNIPIPSEDFYVGFSNKKTTNSKC